MNVNIALDPGFGNTKTVVNGKTCILQSVVTKPRNIGNAAMGMDQGHSESEISFSGKTYAVGSGAWKLGESLVSMDYSSLAEDTRKALFYAGMTELLPHPIKCTADLVIGLPVPLLKEVEESNSVMDSLTEVYQTRHKWNCRGIEYNLKINNVKFVAQPVGAWADWAIDEKFKFRKGFKDAEVAILDLGMNTLDLYVIRGAEVQRKHIGGAKGIGVRRILATMNGHGTGIEEIDSDYRMQKITPNPVELKSWLNEVLGNVEIYWPNLIKFTTVIPCGGGAVILEDELKVSLTKKGAKITWPENPISTNAMGLWKWAEHQSKLQK